MLLNFKKNSRLYASQAITQAVQGTKTFLLVDGCDKYSSNLSRITLQKGATVDGKCKVMWGGIKTCTSLFCKRY